MRELKRNGVPFVCLEQAAGVGGLWLCSSPTSPCYPELTCNSGRFSLTLEEPFAVPSSRKFATAVEALSYLQHFAERHGLLPHCRFGCKVEQADYNAAQHCWTVRSRKLGSGEVVVESFSDLIAASGLNNLDSAARPAELVKQCEAAGLRCLHSAEVAKDWQLLRGQRVLVVGLSISGCDIAAEASKLAASTVLAARTSQYVLPMTLLGVTLDRLAGGDLPDLTRLPGWLSSALLFLGARLLRGVEWLLANEGEQLGLQRPRHSLLDKFPIADDDFKRAVRAGRVQLRPEVQSFSRGRVRYVDDTQAVLTAVREDDIDVVVLATGYRFLHPYLPEELRPASVQPAVICTGRQPSLALPTAVSRTSSLSLLLFSPVNPQLYFMSETTAGMAWPNFAPQARALVSLLVRRRSASRRAARFDRVLSYPNPPLHGPFNGGAYWKETDEFTVERSLYQRLLSEFVKWLEEEDAGDGKKQLCDAQD